MVIIDPIERFHMQRDACIHGEGLEKFAHQIRVEFPDLRVMEGRAEHEERTTGDVECDARQCFIHRQKAIGIACDATQITQRLTDGLAQHNACVFHRVMLINMQIALGLNRNVDEAVTGDLVEHVVKKTNACGEVGFTRAVEVDLDGDLGFVGIASNFGLPRGGR